MFENEETFAFKNDDGLYTYRISAHLENICYKIYFMITVKVPHMTGYKRTVTSVTLLISFISEGFAVVAATMDVQQPHNQ